MQGNFNPDGMRCLSDMQHMHGRRWYLANAGLRLADRHQMSNPQAQGHMSLSNQRQLAQRVRLTLDTFGNVMDAC